MKSVLYSSFIFTPHWGLQLGTTYRIYWPALGELHLIYSRLADTLSIGLRIRQMIQIRYILSRKSFILTPLLISTAPQCAFALVTPEILGGTLSLNAGTKLLRSSRAPAAFAA
jgi:hypothetical protein